jgi:hypothetical protein
MADTASETGREGVSGQATSQLQDAATNAQEKVAEVREAGRNKLSEQIGERTTQAGQQARSMGQALRKSGEQLRSEGDGGAAATFADGVAERMERLGEYMQRADGDELLRDVEGFARRRPWMIAGLGLLGGLAASRFLKASSERRYSSSAPSSGYPYRSSLESPSGGGQATDEPLTRERSMASG